MNETIKNILDRRAIRHYLPRQIEEEKLEQILECGIWAPSAGGMQTIHILVSQNAEVNAAIGRVNRDLYGANGKGGHLVNEAQISIAEDASIMNGFYDAPTVLMLFAPGDGAYQCLNAMAVAENMMIAAKSLGLGSVFISRGNAIDCDEGKVLREKAGIPENWKCLGFVPMGYCDGPEGHGVERLPGRIHRV